MVSNKKVTRRKFLKDSTKLLTGTAIAGFFFNKSCSPAKEELKIGYIPITDATPLLVAYNNGYFKEEGLNVNQPFLLRSWSSLVEAFLADKVNVVHLLIPIPIWMRYNSNAKVKIVCWDHTNGSALTVSSKSGIKSFSDLGGKQIAVPFWYSMHNIILQLGLRKFGLKAVIKPQSEKLKPDEVNLFILPPPEMPASLDGGKIDGFIVAEPFNALAELKTNAKILRFTGDIWKNHPCCVIVMKEKIIKENPVFAQRVVNGIVRAQDWVMRNRNETVNILSAEGGGYLPVSKDVLDRVFNGYEPEKYGAGNIPQAIMHEKWKLNRIDFQPYPYPSATRFIFDSLKKTVVEGDNSFLNKYSTDFVSEDISDVRFVKNAIQAIGGPQIFPEINLNSLWNREEIIEV